MNNSATITTTVTEGGVISSTYTTGTTINSVVSNGAIGPQGPAGPTGGIVPITVSNTAPSNPNINDLWINTT